MFTAAVKNVQQVVEPIIERVDPQTKSAICGYISKDKNWVVYLLTDRNVLSKLLGPELADKFNDNFQYEDGKATPNAQPVYTFFFITDQGMELYKAYTEKRINLGQIKSRIEPK